MVEDVGLGRDVLRRVIQISVTISNIQNERLNNF
jgi:hypothetical protein